MVFIFYDVLCVLIEFYFGFLIKVKIKFFFKIYLSLNGLKLKKLTRKNSSVGVFGCGQNYGCDVLVVKVCENIELGDFKGFFQVRYFVRFQGYLFWVVL